MSDILHDAFGALGQTPTGPNYTHPQQDEIIRDAVALLEEIPEGKRLVEQIKNQDLSIRVMIGKIPGFFVPESSTVVLLMPKILAGINEYETACNLGLGIKEIELNLVNIQRLDADPFSLNKKLIDIVLEMCKIVSEFQDVKNHLKLVDLVEKLGHAEVYRMYRAKASYQEMADQILKTISK